MSEELFKCKKCGSDYTHQSFVEVFVRNEEDGEANRFLLQTSTHVVPGERNGFLGDPKLGVNPSSRRDGVKIHLWCEMCNHISEISIYQHKGQTFIESV